MAKANGRAEISPPERPRGITRITVRGYKSIGRKQTIDIRPLTLLAGANSSGKSSMMQPLLLLKQTLEASYDPGSLLLDGPNLRFRSADEFLFWDRRQTNQFDVSLGLGEQLAVELLFKRPPREGLQLQQATYRTLSGTLVLNRAVPLEEVLSQLPVQVRHLPQVFRKAGGVHQTEWQLSRNRCFFELSLLDRTESAAIPVPVVQAAAFALAVRQVIHLPALRGNPERAYPVAAIGDTFPGTFESYVARLIDHWQATDPKGRLSQVNEDLKTLGLTSRITAVRLNDTQVELRVGRLLQSARPGALDLVNIADVGFGVAQTLPVLVALLAAQPGQLVYLEQPEIHLHPRAQFALARLLANAANRGVQVVAETHSTLLLLGVQTLVAEGYLAPDKAMLHWFRRRDTDGATEVGSGDLDDAGAYGDWPQDFDDVELKAQSRYLNAAEARLRLRHAKR